MDSHNATITGREATDAGDFVVIAHVKNDGPAKNSNESTGNHQEITLTQKFFKEIAATMPNIDEIHLTGTGQIQEQFMKFLADTAQYKNVKTTESTSNRMSDEHLLVFMRKHFGLN